MIPEKSMSHHKQIRFIRVALIVAFLGISPVCFSDSFLKLGIEVHPADDELTDRWLLSAGHDFHTAPSFYLGFEFAGGFYTDKIGPEESRQIAPINAFFNLKYKASNGGVRPFAGAGLGLMSEIHSQGIRHEYTTDLGLHFLGGLEFGAASGNAFLLELQAQKNLSTEGSSDLAWFGFFGLRF